MSLSVTLRNLLARAARHGEAATALERGLHIMARVQPERLRLTRLSGAWGPGPAAEKEALVCAAALGWKQPRLEWRTGLSGQYYLIVTNTTLGLEVTA